MSDEIDQTDPRVYGFVSEAEGHSKQRKYRKAIETLEEANQYYPNNSLILNGLGCAHNGTGKTDKAIEMFLQVISIDPTDTHTYARTNLAEIYLDQGKLDEARGELDKLERNTPNEYVPYVLRAHLIFAQIQAVSTQQQSTDINPIDPTKMLERIDEYLEHAEMLVAEHEESNPEDLAYINAVKHDIITKAIELGMEDLTIKAGLYDPNLDAPENEPTPG